MTLSIDIVKVLIIVSLLISTFIFGILPVIFIRYVEKSSSTQSQTLEEERRRKKSFANYWRILSFLNCFAAGVFLATCLLELLPSVRHNLVRVMFSENIYTGFPLAEFVMVIGLFFILIIEQIALSMKENVSSDSTTKRQISESEDIRQPLLAGKKNDELAQDAIHNDHFLGGLSDQPQVVSNENSLANGDIESTSYHQSRNIRGVPRSLLDNGSFHRSLNNSPVMVSRDEDTSMPNEENLQIHSIFRAMFLLCALALHSVFEGLTVGLQTRISDVLSIFGALVVHKSILSFSLGMNLMQSKMSAKSAIKSIILFSISAPIGLVIGILIMDFWDTTKSGVFHGILQGFASGTFLYIIFFEVLPKEFNSNKDRLLKVLFLIIGYGVITGVLFLSDDVKHPLCLINEKGDHPS